MPVVISPLKDELNKALKEATNLFVTNPEDASAKRFVETIQKIINVCENRKRY